MGHPGHQRQRWQRHILHVSVGACGCRRAIVDPYAQCMCQDRLLCGRPSAVLRLTVGWGCTAEPWQQADCRWDCAWVVHSLHAHPARHVLPPYPWRLPPNL